MIGIRSYRVVAAIAATVMGLSACASVGSAMDDVSGSSASVVNGSTISGEVRSIDTRRGRVQIRDDYNGRTATVRYDGRTRVTYGNREYAVSSLERGDYVRVRVGYDRDGNPWADRIEVSRDRNDDRYNGRTVRLDGTVRQVDVRRGYFTLGDNRDTYLVYVPSRISRDDVRRFERLRRGDRARAEVRVVRRGQAELIRFR
jgi:hypothetical protein